MKYRVAQRLLRERDELKSQLQHLHATIAEAQKRDYGAEIARCEAAIAEKKQLVADRMKLVRTLSLEIESLGASVNDDAAFKLELSRQAADRGRAIGTLEFQVTTLIKKLAKLDISAAEAKVAEIAAKELAKIPRVVACEAVDDKVLKVIFNNLVAYEADFGRSPKDAFVKDEGLAWPNGDTVSFEQLAERIGKMPGPVKPKRILAVPRGR
jgi:hypothetical protein